MKKLLLASAVAALSVTAAQAAPTVYGKAFLTLDVQDVDQEATAAGVTTTTEDSSRAKLNSNGSRIGVKGSEALTNDINLVYQLEYGVDVDADDNGRGQFYSRDTYLGLSHAKYGTVLAGRLTAIDDMVNYANVTAGGVLGGDDVLASISAERANDAVAYVSPNYNGLNFLGMYVMDDNEECLPALEGNINEQTCNNIFGAGVKYEPAGKAYRAGATYIQTSINHTTNSALATDLKQKVKILRVSGDYKINNQLTAGALVQYSDFDTDDNELALAVSGTYQLPQSKWATYAQVDVVDHVAGGKDADAYRLAVGGKYAFNQNTTGHVYGAYLKEEEGVYAAGSKIGTDKSDGIGIGAGLEYKF